MLFPALLNAQMCVVLQTSWDWHRLRNSAICITMIKICCQMLFSLFLTICLCIYVWSMDPACTLHPPILHPLSQNKYCTRSVRLELDQLVIRMCMLCQWSKYLICLKMAPTFSHYICSEEDSKYYLFILPITNSKNLQGILVICTWAHPELKWTSCCPVSVEGFCFSFWTLQRLP